MSTEPGWVRQLSAKHYLNGVFTAAEGSEPHDVIDPATERRIGEIVDASAAEVDRAVEIANSAQRRLNRTSLLHRAELLHVVAADIRAGGGSCELQVWPDQVHVFQALPRLSPEAAKAMAHVACFINTSLRANGFNAATGKAG